MAPLERDHERTRREQLRNRPIQRGRVVAGQAKPDQSRTFESEDAAGLRADGQGH